jgi:hypothetical protein
MPIPGETGVAETVDFTSRLYRKSSVVVPTRSAAVASVACTNVGSSVAGTVGGVESWLKELGLEDRAGDFKREAITVEALARMDDSQLQAMGVERLGDRLTLLGRARDALGRLDRGGSGPGMPPGLQRKKAMDAGSKAEALAVAEESFGKKRSVNLNILQSEKNVMLIDPAHRKTLLKTLSVKQTFRNKWSGLPQMSTALRIAPIHITGHLSAEDGEYVSVVMKNLREYWGNIAVIASLLVSTLLPVLFMNDPALSMRRESWDSSARRKSTGAGEDSAGSLFMTGDWVLHDEHLSYISMTFAMLMSLAACLSLLTLASALSMHIQLFVIMVDLSDQIHFLTHTRVDLPHRLMVK